MVAELGNKILVAGGAVAVAVGAYLPWLRTNPNLPPDAEVPTIYYTGMGAGFEGFDFALLGAVGLVLLLRGASFRIPIRIVAGVGTAVFPVYYLSYSTLFGFSATFVPALGWYLTVLGGILLSVAGGLQLPSLIHRLKATATPRE
ncbi:hypothetical protein [Haladaptatus sp. DFWS20]|uniref:hypothetical protein n=1 Tax=Haladaptatus sp. DFWS20 TaxID=3403467 RepID=UPI003EBBC32B